MTKKLNKEENRTYEEICNNLSDVYDELSYVLVNEIPDYKDFIEKQTGKIIKLEIELDNSNKKLNEE